MEILTTDIYIITLLVTLILTFFFKIQISKYLVISLLIFSAPIIFGYLYNFNYLIYNQILLFISTFILLLFIFYELKKIHEVIIFVALFMVTVYFILSLIVNKSIWIYTQKTYKIENIVDCYYYEYFIMHSNEDKFKFKYPKQYKYVFFDFLKKEIHIENTKYSNNGFTYEFLSDGKIIEVDTLYNSSLIDKLPNVELFEHPTETHIKRFNEKYDIR